MKIFKFLAKAALCVVAAIIAVDVIILVIALSL